MNIAGHRLIIWRLLVGLLIVAGAVQGEGTLGMLYPNTAGSLGFDVGKLFGLALAVWLILGSFKGRSEC